MVFNKGMKTTVTLLKTIADASRLRILMLLSRKELCVCQVMGVLGLSQPLISRNLSLLERAGLVDSRREGKMMFYRVADHPGPEHQALMGALRRLLKDDKTLGNDITSLKDCEEFQKRTGLCGMEGLRQFMEEKKRKTARRS
jgi:ArsR family transcriptional regulator